MNRIDRLSAILIQLQTKSLIKASEIADRFEISLRTVYRDMRALEEAGVPIGSEVGRGYFLVDGYHLPPVMFTREEAGAMLIADKLVSKMGDRSVKDQFTSAIHKIKSVLPEREKDYLEDINSSIQVLQSRSGNIQEFPNNYITTVQKALSESNCLEIKYFSQYSSKENIRIVEPIGLCFYSFAWHLIAFCQLRNDYRDFRIDRVKNLTIKPDCFNKADRLSLKQYFNSKWVPENLSEVLIQFDKKTAQSIQNNRYYFGFIDERINENGVEMSFAVEEFSYMAYWLLSLGKNIKVVKPTALQVELVKIVKDLSEIYGVKERV